MLLQEPYSHQGKIQHMEGGRLYAIEGKPKTAIIVYNEMIKIVLIK